MSLILYGFNVVLRKDSLDRVIKGGAESFIERAAEPRHGAVSVASDDHLVAVRFADHGPLEILAINLLRHRLRMSLDGKFADFAIIHDRHEPRMPCEWLEYERTDRHMVVWMKGTPRDPACYVPADLEGEPVDELVLRDTPSWVEGGYLTQVGHGFVLEKEEGYHAWLDFTTGRVIVNFLPGLSMAVQ